MAYGNTAVATYPDAQVDPRKKGYDWVLQYVRAAYLDSRGYLTPTFQLNTGTLKMAEIKMYSMGRQPVDKYKKMMSPGSPVDDSWRAIDWTVPAFMCKFREIAISKLIQKKFDLQAYTTDPLAKSEEDAYFNQMKVKIMMREAAEAAGSELAQSPVLQPQPGEPEDMEQLMMQQEFGYKHQMAAEAENAFNLVFQQNNKDELMKILYQNQYDFGIGALTQNIDENGMVKVRNVNPEYMGLSYCEKPDFSDLVHWWEIVPTYVGDLAPYYSKDQLDNICKKVLSKNGNPSQFNSFNGLFNPLWNRFKVNVCKIKFLSWNDTIYKEEKDNKGNVRFGKTAYENKQFLSVNKKGELEDSYDDDHATIPEECRGEATPKYIQSTKKVRYKASWIIDTEYMHDWGLDENQNRKLSSWWDTDLDIQIYAWNFYKMQFTGITERLIPLEDRACMAWFNLQNLSNKLIPYLINIEMNSIEGAGFGKGGNKMKPAELMDFIFSNYVVPWRATDLLSRNPNFKPVSIEATGQLQAFAQLYEELAHTIEMMRQISGMNEVTDGSTVNPKNLNSTNQAMVESTNNAMYLVSEAGKSILVRTADAIVQKVQIAVRLGKVAGYAKALGNNTVKFFDINPNISLHELGIFIEDAPTDLQREQLWQDVNIKESQGLLTVGDKAFVMTVRNLTEAYQVLDYKIKKRQEKMQQFELQKIQEAAAANGEVSQMQEQMKQQTIQMQGQIDMQLLLIEKQLDFKIEQMKKSMDLQGQEVQAEGRLNVGQIAAEAKVISQQIAASSTQSAKTIDATSHLLGKQIDGETAKEKQEIANRKPKAAAKS